MRTRGTPIASLALVLVFAACSGDCPCRLLADPGDDSADADAAVMDEGVADVAALADVAGEVVPDAAVPADPGLATDPGDGADGASDPGCKPSCQYRTCGPDGCGSLCGYCDGGSVCVDGQCTCPCPGRPTTWGPAGAATTLRTPADKAEVEAACFDYSGDGKGDNGLRPFATAINDDPDLVDGNPKAIVLEFPEGANLADTASFTLNLLVGRAVEPGSGSWLLEPDAYAVSGQPFGALSGASLAVGVLAAGPLGILFPFRMDDGELATVPLHDVRVSAVVAAKDPGVAGTDGVMGGVILSTDVDVAIAALEARCEAPDPPAACSYLDMLRMQVPQLYDLDLDHDGEGDALSLCLRFDLEPVDIVGYLEE